MMAQMLKNKVYGWLDQRFALGTMQELAGKKTVPVHRHSIWYYMGGIAVMFLIIQVLTGGLLMLYYVPEISAAHASIVTINSQVDFGWFVRSMHSWGANLMILALFVHLFTTYFLKAYRPPREITWLTGLGLLVVVFGFGFTGYLLPWDEVAFFATKVGLDIASQVPFVGETIATILRGGADVSQATLSRFFVIHVFLLPLALVALMGVHMLMVQLHGMSRPDSVKDQAVREEKFFPTFVLKDLMVWLLLFNLLAAFVSFYPWGLGPEADPFAAAPAGIKPEWYFLGMFQFLKVLPAYIGPFEGEHVGMALFALIGLAFVVIPFWERGQNPVRKMWAELFGSVILFLFIVFTVWGMLL
ncbi:MAG: cytochrome b N-terminal domain-containing protein [Cyanobacteria bacterium HKST-UBA04]|nr:cytochrome b N-terminal domain-containing protein [Cyanobacteria bacterium HKST-UBA05]MCA9799162.1 cytochrome b N-terminal domain-containing protein [Cyanobacteria bacterium HKST-UBA04]